MLLSLVPIPVIHSSICPRKATQALLQLILVLTFVASTISPTHCSIYKQIVPPLTLELAPILPTKRAEPAELPILKLAPVVGSIGKLEVACATTLPELEASLVYASIIKSLASLPVLKVVFPSPLIH